MAASRRSPPADASARLRADVERALDALHGACSGTSSPAAVAVALSGGRDSMAMLDVAHYVTQVRGLVLVALHVHHGLSAHADAWADACAAACSTRGVPLCVERVDLLSAGAGNIEARARTARYAALARMAVARHATAVLLAHHQDDQAETLLLQLLRGAGPRGLAGMPPRQQRLGVWWVRPWLDRPRGDIEAHVQAHGLAYVDDDSNASLRLRRNALRAQVVPGLRAMAPGYPATLARAARHQRDAAELLDALACADVGASFDGQTLAASALAMLAPARARNALRWFLHVRGLRPPATERLEAMLRQLVAPRDDARVRIAHDGAEIGVAGGRIVVHDALPEPFAQSWDGRAWLELPHGALELVDGHDEARKGQAALRDAGSATAPSCEVDVARLFTGRVDVRSRRGGERLRVNRQRPRQALKHLLQSARVPPWDRTGLPLVFADDALVAVPGIGVDPDFQPAPGGVVHRIVWHPGLRVP